MLLEDTAVIMVKRGVYKVLRGICLAVLLMPIPVAGEVSKLEALKVKIKGIDQDLKKVKKNKTETVLQVRKIKEEIRELEEGIIKLERQISSTEKRKEALELAVRNTTEEIESLSLKLKMRLRALYMQKPGRVVQAVFAGGSSGERRRAAFLLSKVMEYDAGLIVRGQRLQEELIRNIGKLNDVKERIERDKRASVLQTEELNSRLFLRRALIRKLGKEESRLAALGAEARAQALRIETVISSYSGLSFRSRQVNLSRRSKEIEGEAAGGSYNGRGLFAIKGSLLFPVKGKVLTSFGRRRLTEFKDYVFSKGLEIKASKGAEVKAIAEGRVIYRGKMPVYDEFVILDHGKRYYSVYGKLEGIAVQPGQVVSKGGVLGRVGGSGTEGANFYFEIRQNGKAVDPAKYFGRTLKRYLDS